MTERARRMMFTGLLCATCAGLVGCGAQIDESLLNAQADYSIDISLPYATVTPPPAQQQEEVQALVIDAEGGVTVNDSSSILGGSVDADSAVGNYKSLRQGNTGLAVQALQTRLQELGYYAQDVSGIFDAETEAAVRRFEQTYGTMQTGVATAELQARLFSPDALVYASDAYNEAVVSQYRILQRGDVGSSVYALQQRLRSLGYPMGELTGIFDNETANAIMLFYEAYGLTASDVANVALQKELYSDSARPYGEAAQRSAASPLDEAGSEDISRVQQRLIELGYLNGAPTGTLDRATEIAARLFEEACGQLSSGALSSELLSLLASDSAPRFADFASNYTNLIEGSSGEAVSRLQARLVELGFAMGSPNGEYGASTTASVKLFQSVNGLEETGVASVYAQAVLYSSFTLNMQGETAISAMPAETPAPTAEASEGPSALAPGSRGDDVLNLQNRLTELGYVCSVTGEYDDLTARAVSAFRANLGLDADGSASEALVSLLYSDGAPHSGVRYHEEAPELRALASGDEGDDVTALQRRLWELGYLDREAVRDSVGVYNDATAAAAAALQTAIRYAPADGAANPEFQCYLHSDSALPAAGYE